MARVNEKVALITGAARGIGKATASMLAREGAKVVLSDINEEQGKAAADELRRDGAKTAFVKHDVSREDDWQAAIDHVRSTFGRLDILVNNAGIVLAGSVEEATLQNWRRDLSINLDGVFLGIKYAISLMKKNGGGSIINLSSIEGIIGDPSLAAYDASKGGVRLLTKSAALYCAKAKYNIRVNSVHPGYVWTPMVEELAASKGESEAERQRLTALHPIGRLGEPEDIAYGILYLASDEAKFVTGSELVIDGGYTAQ